MVVERAAGDQAVAGYFEPADLGEHAERFNDEHAADQDELDFLVASPLFIKSRTFFGSAGTSRFGIVRFRRDSF